MKKLFLTVPLNRAFFFGMVLVPWMGLSLAGCSTVEPDSAAGNAYSATARTRYTWRVEYDDRDTDRPSRIETFASTSLVNLNGVEPEGAVTGPDEKGLWWPALPPRPTVDEIEARQKKTFEFPSQPLLHKSVQYEVTYELDGEEVTASTSYSVYRVVVKAHPENKPLRFVTGVNKRSVLKAEPVVQKEES